MEPQLGSKPLGLRVWWFEYSLDPKERKMDSGCLSQETSISPPVLLLKWIALEFWGEILE